MDTSNSKEKPQREPANLETLIQMELEIIHELHKKLKDPDLNLTEWTKVANLARSFVTIQQNSLGINWGTNKT